ncbi:thioredoxin family protein [Kaarinaea lacus]
MKILFIHRNLVIIFAAILFSMTVHAAAPATTQKTPDADEEIGSFDDAFDTKFYDFDDTPLEEDLILPEWFKLSFLDLRNVIEDAKEAGKKGLIVYFGQKNCSYCKAHLEHNWGDIYIVAYTRKYFDVVAIDVRGDRPVADVNGKVFRTEKSFARSIRAQFTPTLIFFDTNGKEVQRLSGYHPPYEFVAALEYVADEHYKRESLNNYLSRAAFYTEYGKDALNKNNVFSSPPYALDRSRYPSQTPLAVFFEKTHCHACDVLHSGPMKNNTIVRNMQQLEVVQLDTRLNTPVITPDGKKTTAEKWAEKLNIYYTPTIIFFDGHGKEIIRINSVVGFYRLNNVLHYVLSKGYLQEPNFQLWRQRHKR